MLSTANTNLLSTVSAQSTGAAIPTQALVSGVKLMKDCIVLIVKIAAHLMDGLELLKMDKESTETFSRLLTGLTTLMMQTSAALLRGFEHFDRIAKPMCK